MTTCSAGCHAASRTPAACHRSNRRERDHLRRGDATVTGPTRPAPPASRAMAAARSPVPAIRGHLVTERPRRPQGQARRADMRASPITGSVCPAAPEWMICSFIRCLAALSPDNCRMDPCLLCGMTDGPADEEHVIPKWARRAFNMARWVTVHASDGPGSAREQIGALPDLNITLRDAICRKCNNEWLSRIEGGASRMALCWRGT
jgi:hypothetical protein